MRLVARLKKNNNNIYGSNPYETSRIDGFLDASLYLLNHLKNILLSINNGSATLKIRNEAKEAL